jgi:hypothetical protein
MKIYSLIKHTKSEKKMPYKNILLFSFIFFQFLIISADAQNKNLKWFGMYSHPVCDGFQDVKFDEFKNFVNVYVELCPDATLSDNLKYLKKYNIKASVSLMSVLFYKSNDTTWLKRENYQALWNDFKAGITEDISGQIHSFYLFDEPLVHNLPISDLNTISAMIKNDFPDIPTLIVESGLPEYISQLPSLPYIDLLGIDIYGIDPFDYDYKTSYNQFKSTLNAKQKIILIADAWWDYQIHNFKNPTTLKDEYYRFAHSDDDIEGVFVFVWNLVKEKPFLRSLALRDLAQTANEYLDWGCEITQKCKQISNPVKVSHQVYLNDKPWSGSMTIQCIVKNNKTPVQTITVPYSVFYQQDSDRKCYYIKNGPENAYLRENYFHKNNDEIIFYYKFKK